MVKKTVFDVADWFLSRDSMSHKKLQRLIYYAYAWVLTLMNENEDELDIKLFNSRIEAWIHGPLIPELYHEYRGKSAILQKSSILCFEEDIEDILEQVWEVYGIYTGNQLESIIHKESPWIEAIGNCPPAEACTNKITDKSIYRYYVERVV